ncbi:glycosyltransferase family 2 protein [Candidatus Avelusimicrobium caledoniensis]|uniref:glycosyltransferase family 2 protein n=1 Tax=Candidatus Avelusimicrobium caledoniensis TaxID=3416220 RepID=UPI003D0B3D2D
MQLSVVIPVFNENEVLPQLRARLEPVLAKCTTDYEIIFVNDGSTDNTLPLLKTWAAQDNRIKIISLSRNFGKEAAVTAGLSAATGQAVIILDADLQDPPEIIPQFWAKFKEGFDNVYGVRQDRRADSFFKRTTANSFYKLYNRLADTPIPHNAGDYRLLSRRAVNAVLALPERERFMKGLFTWVGYKSVAVPFTREKRAAGKTKWSYWKLWNFALNGLTASTTLPLKLWTYFGLFISCVSFVFALWTAYKKLVFGNPVSGYTSIMVAILFFSGVQLITLGVIGEYLSRIFNEVKQRPAYFIDEKINL